MEPPCSDVLPLTARMILKYAECIELLNTGSRKIFFQACCDNERQMDRVGIQGYGLVPKELGFGANLYQAAVKAEQAGPYLLFHIHYHRHIATLTQESFAGEDRQIKSPDLVIANKDLKRNLGLRRSIKVHISTPTNPL